MNANQVIQNRVANNHLVLAPMTVLRLLFQAIHLVVACIHLVIFLNGFCAFKLLQSFPILTHPLNLVA